MLQHAPIWGDGGKRLWGHLGLAMPLIPLNSLQERDSSLTLGARGNKCRDSFMATLSEGSGCRNAGYPSFQGHLEGEEARSRGHDCFRNYISGNYITAEAHPGPSLPASGGARGGKGSGNMGQQELGALSQEESMARDRGP